MSLHCEQYRAAFWNFISVYFVLYIKNVWFLILLLYGYIFVVFPPLIPLLASLLCSNPYGYRHSALIQGVLSPKLQTGRRNNPFSRGKKMQNIFLVSASHTHTLTHPAQDTILQVCWPFSSSFACQIAEREEKGFPFYRTINMRCSYEFCLHLICAKFGVEAYF